MPFDPVSWAIGLSATRGALAMYDKMFGSSLRSRIDEVAQEWAKVLPQEIHTFPEALLLAEGSGPARETLQSSLYEKKMIPNTNLWLSALVEAWEFRRAELGDCANGFFKQLPKDATAHLEDLATSLDLVCKEDSTLFQVTALTQLDEIANVVRTTHSDLLAGLEKISGQPVPTNRRAICQLLEQPHHANLDGMLGLNALLLVDAPSAVVAGRLRRSVSWVGPIDSNIDGATYVPPRPEQLPIQVAQMVERWSGEASPFTSNNVSEIHLALARFHHELVALHPFEDGNGRVARVLSDYQAKHLLNHDAPLELRNDQGYLPALSAADNDDYEPFVKLLSVKLGS